MLDHTHPIARQLLELDKRYRLEAYVFVFSALEYAHTVLGLGAAAPREQLEEDKPHELPPPAEEAAPPKAKRKSPRAERHLTGQELCEAIRRYALDQFGLMAKCVLNSWGVYATSDFGNIVFNLIDIGQMKKTKKDRREDFDNVFNFDTELAQNYRIKVPKSAKNL